MGKLSLGLCKPARRLVHEMIGIQARQSVRLSEVVRSLEENIPFIKTEMRLSNNPARPALRPVLQRALLREGDHRVGWDSLLVLDPSDVIKPYALKMECPARVRDGSKKEIGNGYETMQVIAVEPDGEEITPLYGDLFSSKAEDFVSENDEILRAIRLVSTAAQRRGIWGIDRGGDRGELYDELVPLEKG